MPASEKAVRNSLAQGIESFIYSLSAAPQTGEFDVDVLIVGSGYGGAVAACRLARVQKPDQSPLNVVVFERGREYLPGDFPNRFAQLPGEVRFQNEKTEGAIGNAHGLLDFHFDKDVSILRANGLGGGSLINASVAEPMDFSRWQAPQWPNALRINADKFEAYYDKVRKMLAVQALPYEKWPQKTHQLRKLGEAIGQQPGLAQNGGFRPVQLALNQSDGTNAYGIQQQACVGCGDCFTGCNFNAKNSLNTNYLADAKRFGARMYTGASVRYLEKMPDQQEGWLVHFVLTDAPNCNAAAASFKVRAKMVVLAAGALGSSEILLRSRHHGLRLSETLGSHFSGNGDMIWAGFQQNQEVKPSADEYSEFAQRNVGPTITAMLDLRGDALYPRVIQDAAVPASLYRVFGEIIAGTELLYRMAKPCVDETGGKLKSDPDALNFDHLQHTALYLSMGYDQASGKIHWQPSEKVESGGSGTLNIDWSHAAKQHLYQATEASLAHGVAQLGGQLLASPTWRAYPRELENVLSGKKPEGNLISVHPLGGCPMADNVSLGVVNHLGAVFDGVSETSVYAGLYVWDGSIIPLSIGINPFLTIAALAERAVEHTALAQGWQISQAAAPEENASNRTSYQFAPISAPAKPQRTAFKFSEIMEGDLRLHPHLQRKLGSAPSMQASAEAESKSALQVNFMFDIDILPFLSKLDRQLAIRDAWLHLPHGEKIALEGHVEWLHLIPRWHWKKVACAFWAYGRLRALPDALGNGSNGSYSEKFFSHLATLPSLGNRLRSLISLASHTGSLRQLRYVLKPKAGQNTCFGAQEWNLTGIKRVEYKPGNNLWSSLSDLKVEIRNQRHQRLAHGVLRLNWAKLLKQKAMQLVGRTDNPNAWLDMLSISGFFLRAIVRIHFWNFRKPDYAKTARQFPRPGDLPGLQRQWYAVPISSPILPAKDLPLKEDRAHPAPCIELTHYRSQQAHRSGLPPVLLIHGFGASGLQFTTDAMPQNMAQYLCQQGRDVWVLELRTSVALLTRKQQWKLDEVAQSDIPSAVRFILAKSAMPSVDVVAHCIGSAMFNIAVLAGRLQGGDGKSLIHSAVLLQVGPTFEVSKSNKIRGAAVELMRDMLGFDSLDSSMDETSAKAEDSLLDRLMATHPLPESEARKLFPKLSFTVRTDLANYFRSTSVFGRLFELDNLSPAMRDKLGDLLGPTNMTTYQQILHSLLTERLVDQYGRNIYVLDENFASFYRFPTMFLYGEKNNVFAQGCTQKTWQRLCEIFGQSDSFRWTPLSDFGHLDPLIGIHAPSKVFPEIGDFLNHAPDLQLKPVIQAAPSFLRRAAELGPVLGWTRPQPDGNGFICRIWLKLAELSQALDVVETFLLNAEGQFVAGSYQQYAALPFPRFNVAVCDIALPDAAHYTIVTCARYHGLPSTKIAAVRAELLPPLPTAEDILQALQGNEQPLPHTAADQAACWQAYQQAHEQLSQVFSCAQPMPVVNQHATSKQVANSFCFALGSCRYSGSGMEIERGDHSMQQLFQHLQNSQADWQPALCLLMGDQIYVDATAGVMERKRRPELIFERYLEAFGSPNARKLFASLPIYPMLDDHEIQNDWEPPTGTISQFNQQWNNLAQACFLAYQWANGPRNACRNSEDSACRGIWYDFESGGIPFFVMDTRLERDSRHAHWQGQAPRIVSKSQMAALENWLKNCQEKYGKRPKFIISPSAFAPIDREHAGQQRSRCDGWYAYPQSIQDLADILIQHNISNTVMLTGDLHACFASKIKLGNSQGQAYLHSLVFSPQYAPYSFINTALEDVYLDWPEKDAISEATPEPHFSYESIWQDADYQGFGLVKLDYSDKQWRLTLGAPGREKEFATILLD